MESFASLDATPIRAGTNFLAQAARRESDLLSLLLPSPHGLLRLDSTGGGAATTQTLLAPHAPGAQEGASGRAVAVLAWSPCTAELIALAFHGCAEVQIWRADGAGTAHGGVRVQSIQCGGPCRELAWHPQRRVLLAATAQQAQLLVTTGDESRVDRVVLRAAGGWSEVRRCCWSVDGRTLGVGCEQEAVLFDWPVLGAWQQYEVARLRLTHRRLCSLLLLSPSAAVLGLGAPIAVSADAGERAAPQLTACSSHSVRTASQPTAEHDASTLSSRGVLEPESRVVDLRGKLGGAGGGVGGADCEGPSAGRMGAAALFNLGGQRAEAATQAGGAALRLTGESGAVQLCHRRGGELAVGAAAADTAGVGAPDILASSNQSAASGAAGGCLVVGSNFSGRVHVFTLTADGAPLLAHTLQLPDGFGCRGLFLDRGEAAFVLAGRRQRASVVFSSPAAPQELVLCTFSPALPPQPAAGNTVGGSKPAATEEPRSSLEASRPPAHGRESPRGSVLPPDSAPAAGAHALLALQTHLDERFDRMEMCFGRLEARVARLEAALPRKPPAG